jgi:hypothetical protein
VEESEETAKKAPQPKRTTNSRKNDASDSDDIFELEYHTMKKLHLPIKRRLSKGAWTLEENRIYRDFLLENKDSFTTEAKRREERVFCQLSKALNHRRTPDQCRSHHLKLLGTRQSVS